MGNLLKVISSNSVLAWMDGITELINSITAPILWGLCDIFFLLLELFDWLYKKFAGIEDFVVGKDTVNQDPVLYLINTNVVQEMFFSILSLSVILLVIFTIFAIVKNIYAEKPKPLGEILRSMTKALLMYLLVPVATIVCLLVGNVVLRAIDGATKVGGANSTAGMLFLSAGYNGNKIRAADSREDAIKQLNTWLNNGDLYPSGNTQLAAKYISIMEDNDIEVLSKAEIVDSPRMDLDEVARAIDEAFVNGVIASYTGHTTSIYSLFNVMNYYHIGKVSLISVWAGGVFLIFAMGKITWGLISRMFKMTVYFAISPALMAMFPIKGDAVLKSWTGEMVKNATMAYCAIGVMNVVLSVLPAFSQIKFFAVELFNEITALFITIVALTSAEKLISTVSGWFGTGDALAEGKAAQSGAMKPTKAVMSKATGAFVGAVSAAKGAKDVGMGKGKQFGAFLSGAMGGAGLKNPIAKHIQDSKKAGEEKFKEMDTTNILTGNVNKQKLAEYEGREAAAKEAKIVNDKIDELNNARNVELASATTPAQIAEINKRYDDQIDDMKRDASFVKAVHSSEDLVLESRRKALDKKKTTFQPLNQMLEVQADSDILKGQFETRVGFSISDDQWRDIKQGNFAATGLTGSNLTAAQAAASALTSEIVDINQREEKAARAIENAFNSSTKAQSEMRRILHDPTFSGDLRNITSAQIAYLEAEQNDLERTETAIEASARALSGTKVTTFDSGAAGTLTPDEARRVGKNKK